MKSKLLYIITAVALLFFPKVNFGQAPTLGTASSFVLFTGGGAFTAVGASYVTGNIGTYAGAFSGFPPGTLVGQSHVADPASASAAADVGTAYGSLSGVTCGVVLGVTLGNGQVLTPNVYCLGAASTLNDTLYLNAQGNANALFIFKINGALSTSTYSHIVLLDSASICNVYWQINGAFTLGDGSIFMGTIVSNGAITLNTGATLIGRGLTTAGDISISATTATISTGCSSSSCSTNITTAPTNQTACAGSSAGFSIAATGTGLTYQWRKGATNLSNGGSISGATSDTLIINPVNSSDVASNYNVVISGTCAPNDTSSNVSLTVNIAPKITTAPTNQTACSGSSAGFSVTATGTGLTYHWRQGTTNLSNGGNISGTTSATLTINPVNSSDVASNYNVVITGTCSPKDSSTNVSLTLNSVPKITTAPTDQTACTGSSAGFSVAATGTGLTYQWRKGTANLTNTGNISGATSATLTINPVSSSNAASNYNVIISGTCSPKDSSTNVSLTVNTAPGITTAPSNQAVCAGSAAVFSVVATGTGLTYQWRKGTAILTNGGNISGATSASLTINSVNSSDAASNYNVVISGTCSPKDTSTDVSLTVNTAPRISTAPANQTACAGSSAGFSVVATGTGLTYHWRKGATNLSNGGNISGATSATLTINPVNVSDTSTKYNVVISGTCSPKDSSANVSLTVNTAPRITSAPANQTVCSGSSAVFSVAATGTGLTYQWRKGTGNFSNGGNISGATSATLTINSVNSSDAASNYNVVISGTCSPRDSSAYVSLTVNTAPGITTAPTNQIACAGSSAGFSVVATGTGLTYQWRKGATNLTNSGNITGVTSASLTINPVNMSDTASNYNVVISGTCSPRDSSANVSLTVNTAPDITTAPADQTACAGSSAEFSVSATGTGLTYYWRKGVTNLTNGGNISGATSATLTINPVISSDASSDYNVVIIGTCSPNYVSPNVSLTVNTAPGITTAASNQTACVGSSVDFSVVASGTGLLYQWRKGTTNLSNGGNISGASSAILTINPVNSSDAAPNYNVVISGTCLPNDSSSNVSLTVNIAPIISTAPTNQTACAGSSVDFTVAATGTGLTYQWRKGAINLSNGGNISGTTSPVLTINPVYISDTASNYNVVIIGTCSPNDISKNVSLTVNTAPSITSVPTNQTACAGSSVDFSVAAIGTGLTYQWRKSSVNLTNGGNISGATSAILTINPVNSSDAASDYDVVITGICSPNSTSPSVSLTVNTAPDITIAPYNQTACAGSSVNFSVDAIGTGLTYQWRKGSTDLYNGGNISGATSATLTINSVNISDAATNYNVVITGICSPVITSANVSLTVNTAPSIIREPISQMAHENGSISFSVTATGTGLTYQWRKGTTNLTNTGNISGATSATLTIYPVSVSDTSSEYNVIITGTCSPNITSVNAILFVCICPPTDIAPVDAGNTNTAATIYPNPFTTLLNIIINDPLQINKCELMIYNIKGAEVLNTPITKQVTTLETSNLPSGNYFYRIIGNNKIIQSGKLVSQQ